MAVPMYKRLRIGCPASTEWPHCILVCCRCAAADAALFSAVSCRIRRTVGLCHWRLRRASCVWFDPLRDSVLGKGTHCQHCQLPPPAGKNREGFATKKSGRETTALVHLAIVAKLSDMQSHFQRRRLEAAYFLLEGCPPYTQQYE